MIFSTVKIVLKDFETIGYQKASYKTATTGQNW